jgi:hypothetical protein
MPKTIHIFRQEQGLRLTTYCGLRNSKVYGATYPAKDVTCKKCMKLWDNVHKR